MRGNLPRLVIRADAGPQIGTGHFMRCLALGQGWMEARGQVVFITASRSPALLGRARREGFRVRRLREPYPHLRDPEVVREALRSAARSWAVLDSYTFDEAYQHAIVQAGHPVLTIDDDARLPRYEVDAILNQNLNAASLRYRTRSNTRLLLGPAYVLLRREFRRRIGRRRKVRKDARRILVTLGGADPMNATTRVLEGLQAASLREFQVTVVIGPDNPHSQEISRVARRGSSPVRLLQGTDAIADLMALADLAIAGGGTTTWELAFMGVPTLSVVMAANQRELVENLDHAAVLKNLGWHDKLSADEVAAQVTRLARNAKERAQMSRRGTNLVDGRGVERVVHVLNAIGVGGGE